jgi:hypothetical protein
MQMDLVLIWLVALALAVLVMKIADRKSDVLHGGFIDNREHDFGAVLTPPGSSDPQ